MEDKLQMSLKYSFYILMALGLIWLTSVREAKADPLRQLSRDLSAALHQEQYGVVSELVEQLLEEGRARNYQNFSESASLLIKAARLRGAGDPVASAFLVRQAARLAPGDPRIAFEAQKIDSLSTSERIKLLGIFLKSVVRFPTAALSLVMEALLVSLAAMTFALLIFCIAQLGVHCADLIEGIGDYFPPTIWGYAGPVATAIVFVAPLPFGVGPTLFVWAMLLGFFVRRCRWLPAFVGAVVLAWMLSSKFVPTIRTHLTAPELTIREEMANGVYRPSNLAQAATIASDRHADTALWALLGAEYARERRWEPAIDATSMALRSAEVGSDLTRQLLLNLSTLLLQSGDPSAAKLTLDRARAEGADDFEYHFIAAQERLAATDLRGQAIHFAAMEEKDKSRFEKILRANSASLPLYTALPTSVLYQPYFAPGELSGRQRFEAEQTRVSLPLDRLFGLMPLEYGWFAAGALIFFGVFIWRRSEYPRGRILSQVRNEQRSLVSKGWALLPGALFVAGRRPFVGTLTVMAMISTLMVLSGIPLQLPLLHGLVFPFSGILWGVIIVLFFSSVVMAITSPSS